MRTYKIGVIGEFGVDWGDRGCIIKAMTAQKRHHLIPIELGGNPTAIENLWPQLITGNKGSRAKNGVEQELHKQVCDGTRGFRLTQSAIASDWTKVE